METKTAQLEVWRGVVRRGKRNKERRILSFILAESVGRKGGKERVDLEVNN